MDEGLAYVGAALGALGAGLVLIARPRAAVAAGFVLLGAAEASLIASLVPLEDLRLAAGSAVLAAGIGTGILIVAAAAYLFIRLPALVAPLVLGAAPFRLPIELGQQRAFLLLPLYVVLAGAVLALLVRARRAGDLPGVPMTIAVPATSLLALSAISLFWSLGRREGIIALVFFLFPFAALLAVLARAPFPAWLPRALAVILVALASLFAVVGLWQLESRNLFFAKDLEAASTYMSFFRVSSVFTDPSLYGRHLVLAIAVVVVALWLGRIPIAVGTGVIAFLWIGLYFSYSQSSMLALIAAVLGVTVFAADRVSRNVVLAAMAIVALLGAGAFAAVAKDQPLTRVTSARSDLMTTTAAVIREHPVVGVGIGGHVPAMRAETEWSSNAVVKASHTTPLTVAAELGVVGVAAYLAFLVGAARTIAWTRQLDAALPLALGAVFFAIFVHSLFYSGFFEDPLIWGVLGVAASAFVTHAPARERAPLAPRQARFEGPALVRSALDRVLARAREG